MHFTSKCTIAVCQSQRSCGGVRREVRLQPLFLPQPMKSKCWDIVFDLTTYFDIFIHSKHIYGGGPISVAVSCPDGYTGTDPSYPTLCVTQCGNGYTTADETWDDGNTLDGDGWSGDCSTLEPDWFVCHQTATFKTQCRNIWNSSSSDYSAKSTNTSLYCLIMLIIGFIANILDSMASGSSSASAFCMINTVQLLLLLPLIPEYMPETVINFMYGLNVCLGAFSFLKLGGIAAINSVVKWFEFDQNNSYLYVIGLQSKSSFVNTYQMLGFMLILPFVHALVWMIKCWIKKKVKFWIWILLQFRKTRSGTWGSSY